VHCRIAMPRMWTAHSRQTRLYGVPQPPKFAGIFRQPSVLGKSRLDVGGDRRNDQAASEFTECDMSKWLRPLKVREYYLDSHFDSIRAADKWLYLAVVRGVVRARCKGFVLGPEWIKQLSKMTYDDHNPFALPPDIDRWRRPPPPLRRSAISHGERSAAATAQCPARPRSWYG
jgi:hypothetical protein